MAALALSVAFVLPEVVLGVEAVVFAFVVPVAAAVAATATATAVAAAASLLHELINGFPVRTFAPKMVPGATQKTPAVGCVCPFQLGGLSGIGPEESRECVVQAKILLGGQGATKRVLVGKAIQDSE